MIEDELIKKEIKPTCVTSKRAQNALEHLKRLDVAIHVEDLTIANNTTPILWDIDIEIPTGAMIGIIGPHGAGKTTLLKAILGMVTPNAGNIYIYGKHAKDQKKLIAYVPHRSNIDWDFPINVFDTVLMGTYSELGWLRRPGRLEEQKVKDALKKVGMYELRSQQIATLSSTQQQRTLFARALARDSSIFLLDEPFQGVDLDTEKLFIDTLNSLRNGGKTIVVVHPDIQTAKEYFDTALLINVRRVAMGDINDVLSDKNIRLAYGAKNSSTLFEQESRSFTTATQYCADRTAEVVENAETDVSVDIVEPQQAQSSEMEQAKEKASEKTGKSKSRNTVKRKGKNSKDKGQDF